MWVLGCLNHAPGYPLDMVQQKSVTVTLSGTAKKCHCKRMAYTVSLKATEFYYKIGNWEIRKVSL